MIKYIPYNLIIQNRLHPPVTEPVIKLDYFFGSSYIHNAALIMKS